LKSGLAIEPNSWFGHFQLGLTYFALKDYSNSADEFHRAEELDPDFAEVHIRLANVYLRCGNPAMAFAEFESYLKKDPKGRFAAQVRETLGEMRNAGTKPPPS
ncbi:MAG TPA: tetratricopeptide repeat protein, partial [Terriglobia bacterium]|nr:tetratricopeptide repeat protein [Terriglobia bacterium]